MKTCPYCESEIANNAKKCRYCGEIVVDETKKRICPFCEAEVSETAKKCKHCGEWLEGNNKFINPEEAYNREEKYDPIFNSFPNEAQKGITQKNSKVSSQINESLFNPPQNNNELPRILCDDCGYVGYAKKSGKREFEDGAYGIVELAVGRLKLQHKGWFVCPKCKSKNLLITAKEEERLTEIQRKKKEEKENAGCIIFGGTIIFLLIVTIFARSVARIKSLLGLL